MNRQKKAAPEPVEMADKRGVAQFVFVLTGLVIIAGGIWTLYMADAPYHPQDQVTRDGISLTDN